MSDPANGDVSSDDGTPPAVNYVQIDDHPRPQPVKSGSDSTFSASRETSARYESRSTTTSRAGSRRPQGSASPSADLPNAFSRREVSTARPPSSSVYSGSNAEQPAWLKSEKTADKYDKYGTRSSDASRAPIQDSNEEKYSRYGSSARSQSSRIKRPREDEEEPNPRELQAAAPEEDWAQPYSNAANPASYQGTVPNQAFQRQYHTFQSQIKDRSSKDINSIVRSHYNQRTYQSKLQGPRTQSPIYKLRNFNNCIKYILLGNFVKKQTEYEGKPSTILDLCCGKGGDLNKVEFINLDQYIGIDISDASVKEAFTRYSQNKARFIPRNQTSRKQLKRYKFEACFATGDCFTYPIPEILEPNFPGIIDKLFPVDCVSIQFALHYAFETEDKVHSLLNNVSKSLRQGGTFIGTIPSSDFIRDKIVRKDYMPDKDGKKRFGNDLYSVTFDKEPPADGVFRPPFGNKYNYSLKDAIDDVPEYVVPFETLRALCEDYGLTLKYRKNFIDIFNQEIPKYFSRLNENLIEGMKRSDGKYGAEGHEKEAVGFYIGFVFEKLA
ncbi:guanine-N(7)-methyltransferase [Suhomyces tanzawaensis NRRL Y-17324]|uniref:mRNA cap guanine-N(7) methyltransferase n=1 Tax=Suhomyces tanzawaensis NRRL Y-17324 TaxID=984487 RepID=A0A1E4SMG3_9ASCO|nr:guanine-N(7)-methyltransferase [Suhomyces tanzawaensis NRRL Y-17324]ODV80719.1 guanine-N(7)-methyltransferase [Suhomyces tanzawaensis NRRL Y-17324]